MLQWANEYKKKVIEPCNLRNVIEPLKKAKKTIATLNGSFDLLHAGHLHIIYEAAQAADILLVALNSDCSIKKYKSSVRPIVPLEYRLQMITALEFVDYATWFYETDPLRFLEIVKPTVHVNGAEYGVDCLEADLIRSHGGTLYSVPLVKGLSTSYIVEKIKEQIKA